MQKFEVEVQVMASQGGDVRKVQVEALGVADAIVKATLKLEDQRIDRWTLKRVTSITN